jgi:hypothetical protein
MRVVAHAINSNSTKMSVITRAGSTGLSSSANIAILCLYSTLFSSLHFLRRGRSHDVALLRFCIAMYMLALFIYFSLYHITVLFSSSVEA